MSIMIEPELTYRVRTVAPLPSTEGSPYGTRQFWTVSEATLEGGRINATLAAPGSDSMRVDADGFWRPDVRIAFRTEDGDTILMQYNGLVEQTDAFKRAALENRETKWDEQYMRLALWFDTGAERYQWLNRSLFIARGRLLGTGLIEYEVYRVA